MTGKKGRKKRFWSDDEKRSICGQARAPGVSVARVARRYSMHTNLIHTWLRDPRFASDATDDGCAEAETAFVPVEIEGPVSTPPTPLAPVCTSMTGGSASAQRVDITGIAKLFSILFNILGFLKNPKLV